MASWASKRKIVYLGITLIVIIAIIVAGFFLIFYKAPTCSDGIQNGNETGIDCGGSCTRLCLAPALPPIVLWSRVIKVTDGVYNTVAYIENQNQTIGVKRITYSFKIYDKDGILIDERRGETTLSVNQIFPIFEGGYKTNDRIPTRVLFSFVGPYTWQSMTKTDTNLVASDVLLKDEKTSPRVEAVLKNNSITQISNIEALATVFDDNGNAIGISRTIVQQISAGDSATMVFTWPNPFPTKTSRIEIIPHVIEF